MFASYCCWLCMKYLVLLTASISVCFSGMFASCCNWLCMDSADVEQPDGDDRRHQSYTNSAFSSQPSPSRPEYTCKACGGCFDTPAKKVTAPTYCSLIFAEGQGSDSADRPWFYQDGNISVSTQTAVCCGSCL